MFAKAYSEAIKWTRPLITSVRYADGRTESNAAAMFIINKDGWAFTAGHVFDSFIKFQNDKKKLDEIKRMNGPDVQPTDPNLLLNHSNWFGQDGVRMTQVTINRACDFALLKLEGISGVTSFPTFRDPRTVVPGTSLCRLGYPINKVSTVFHADKNAFEIPQGAIPPAFPNEGIHTRNVVSKVNNIPPGQPEPMFVETSSPGLKGQSGGPIFDAQGRIYAMQSRTMSFDTGFRPEYTENGVARTVPQFLNLGWGVHVKILVDLMDQMHVDYRMDEADASAIANSAPESTPIEKSGCSPKYEIGPDGSKYIID